MQLPALRTEMLHARSAYDERFPFFSSRFVKKTLQMAATETGNGHPQDRIPTPAQPRVTHSASLKMDHR